MLGDNSADDGQAESRASFAGGEIRFEDSFAVFGWDARAGVGDDQLKALPLRDLARNDRDSAISGDFGHRFSGVVDQVYQRPFDLFAIDHYGGERRGERPREPHPLQYLALSLPRSFDTFVSHRRLPWAFLAAGRVVQLL